MMDKSPFVARIRNHFEPRMEDLGFREVHQECLESGWCLVVLESPDFRIRVFDDRGQVLAAVGPHDAPLPWSTPTEVWFDLARLIQYVSGGTDPWDNRFRPDSMTQAAFEEEQLTRIATALHGYYADLCRLFRKDAFAGTYPKLKAFCEEEFRRFLSGLSRT